MISAVLLDKDGTILDIEKTWVPVAKRVVTTLVEEFAPKADEQKLLASIGIVSDRVIESGSMASGTNEAIARDMIQSLSSQGFQVEEMPFAVRSEALFTSLARNVTVCPLVKDLKGLLTRIKDRGLIIGLATADTEESAEYCLSELGVLDLFDFIGADDGTMPAKPDPAMMTRFCKEYQLDPSEVAMVGDTQSDMMFGKNAGAGLLIGLEESLTRVGKMADYWIKSLDELIDQEQKMIWERTNERNCIDM